MTQTNNWVKRFNKQFPREGGTGIDRFCRIDYPPFDKRGMENFISKLVKKQISLAVTEERRRIVEMIKNTVVKVMDILKEQHPGISHLVVYGYLDELINKITTEDSTPSINTDSATKID